jgi:hypothetical protein
MQAEGADDEQGWTQKLAQTPCRRSTAKCSFTGWCAVVERGTNGEQSCGECVGGGGAPNASNRIVSNNDTIKVARLKYILHLVIGCTIEEN